MAGGGQVIGDPLQGQRMGGHVPDFTAFTENAQMDYALAGLEIAHAQAAQFFTPQPMVLRYLLWGSCRSVIDFVYEGDGHSQARVAWAGGQLPGVRESER